MMAVDVVTVEESRVRALPRALLLIAVVVAIAGSVLTVLPLPLGFLLVGRAAVGCGLAMVPLMMAAAREHLDKDRVDDRDGVGGLDGRCRRRVSVGGISGRCRRHSGGVRGWAGVERACVRGRCAVLSRLG
jgi:hypothetical protein